MLVSFNMSFKIKVKFIAIYLIIFLTGCASVPITGRKQLSLVPASQLEMLSSQGYGEIIKDAKLSTDSKQNALLQRVGNRIAVSTEKFMRENGMGQNIRNYDWEFKLIEDQEKINAFAMAGGKIGVYTGIFSVAKDEAQLATVISHEISHVIANHAGERMSQLLVANLGNVILSQALKEKPGETKQLAMLAYGAGANIAVLLPYSRTHES
jgi:predicted Zn-dependent protease